MPQTKEQKLIKKRELEKRRFEKIKNDPALYAEHKQKNKQKYQRRKREGKVMNISRLSAREQSELRKKWREDARKSYKRKKQARSSRLADSRVIERVQSPVSRRLTRSSEPRSSSPRDSIDDKDTDHPENPGTSVGLISNRPSNNSPSSQTSSNDTVSEENSDNPLSSFACPPSLALSTYDAVDSFENLRTSMNVTNRSRDVSPLPSMFTSDRSASGSPTHQASAQPQQLVQPPIEPINKNEIDILRSQLRFMSVLLVLILLSSIASNWILIWFYIL